jgi:hypothetical protein
MNPSCPDRNDVYIQSPQPISSSASAGVSDNLASKAGRGRHAQLAAMWAAAWRTAPSEPHACSPARQRARHACAPVEYLRRRGDLAVGHIREELLAPLELGAEVSRAPTAEVIPCRKPRVGSEIHEAAYD